MVEQWNTRNDKLQHISRFSFCEWHVCVCVCVCFAATWDTTRETNVLTCLEIYFWRNKLRYIHYPSVLKRTSPSKECQNIGLSENRGSYTSGHFIWNLWNEPSASFINFVWNDHKYKILFNISYDRLKWYNPVRFADMDVVNDVMNTLQSVITPVLMLFLWYGVIQWTTATPYDKPNYLLPREAKRLFNPIALKMAKIP